METFKQKKIIGIVGGMGPQAGLSLFQNILSNSNAKVDQDHLSTILMSLPGEIVDRTSYIKGEVAENPAYTIAKIIEKLELAGANVIGMACNTSHCPEILDVIKQEMESVDCKAKLLHMPAETCKFLKKNFIRNSKIGLMTTNGTYKTGLYERLLKRYNFEPVIPDFRFQENIVHRMIYDQEFGIKASSNLEHPKLKMLLRKAMSFFKKQKTDAIILGCTEFPLLLNMESFDGISLVDPTNILAKALIREAKHEVNSLMDMSFA